jgi:hypothetical protein
MTNREVAVAEFQEESGTHRSRRRLYGKVFTPARGQHPNPMMTRSY